MKMNKIMPTLVLGSICLIVALLLSFVNMITAPIIQESQNAAANASLLEVLPSGNNFEEFTIDETYPPAITKGYRADGGFVFQATVTGKSSGLIIMCGIDSDGKIVGTKVIADQETDGYDANVFPFVEGTNGKYTGMSLDSFEPYLVSGATLTSSAYGEAMKAALQAFTIANGGSVDIRTPEQILQDNCNAALGTVGVTFEKWFATEALDGVDAVYLDGNGNTVYIIGEIFVGINASGEITTPDVSDETVATVTAANEKLVSSTLSEVIELPEGIPSSVKKIYVTGSGNYVFDLVAKGYQALFDYGSGATISIKVSISADGKIIDCLTTSHEESKGYGDACAAEEYYEQYRGASSTDIKVSVSSPDAHMDQIPSDTTDIGAISSATFTTYGYQKAIKAAFTAFEILTGGEMS